MTTQTAAIIQRIAFGGHGRAYRMMSRRFAFHDRTNFHNRYEIIYDAIILVSIFCFYEDFMIYSSAWRR